MIIKFKLPSFLCISDQTLFILHVLIIYLFYKLHFIGSTNGRGLDG